MDSAYIGQRVYGIYGRLNNGNSMKVIKVDSNEHEAECELDNGETTWQSIDNLQSSPPSEFKL